jgi:hypothetical protein
MVNLMTNNLIIWIPLAGLTRELCHWWPHCEGISSSYHTNFDSNDIQKNEYPLFSVHCAILQKISSLLIESQRNQCWSILRCSHFLAFQLNYECFFKNTTVLKCSYSHYHYQKVINFMKSTDSKIMNWNKILYKSIMASFVLYTCTSWSSTLTVRTDARTASREQCRRAPLSSRRSCCRSMLRGLPNSPLAGGRQAEN